MPTQYDDKFLADFKATMTANIDNAKALIHAGNYNDAMSVLSEFLKQYETIKNSA